METLIDSGALDIIADLLEQHCWQERSDDLDSGFITANANAMRFLAQHGRFDITMDTSGRHVTGKVIW